MMLTTTAMTASDAVLVAAIQDPSAVAELSRRHAAAIRRAAARLTQDVGHAEDVTQDVLFRLFREPHRFDPARGTLRALLVTMARRSAIDLLRSEAARKARQVRVAQAVPPPPDVESYVMDHHRHLEVRAALHRLKPEVQEAVMLAFFGRLTYSEVAVQLGLPEGTVKSRIRSGLGQLREAMTDEG